MHNNFSKTIRATIIDIVVALLMSILVIAVIYTVFGKQINMAISLVNTVSAGTSNEVKEVKVEVDMLTDGESVFKTYPAYGQKYAKMNISSAGIELPIYFGDSLEILKKGIGHSTGSYMPGQGSSIVMCAHNSADKFRNLSKVKKGDIITIETDYGVFNYKAYDMQVISETEENKLPIQKESEKLMIYTCYPFDALGYTTKRYVIYSDLENWQAK